MSSILSRLNEIDSALFLLLNGMHNQFFDYVMFWASNRWIWIPFYAWTLFRIYKLFGKKTITVIVLTALLITASDQLSNNAIKNIVKRPRPCHKTSLQVKVHLVNGAVV